MYETRMVRVGNLTLGGHNPVWVQSMTNTDTRDAQATLAQIRALAKAGCDIVRVSVYDEDCARAVRTLVDASPVPLVADIHFNHRLAIAAAENGIHKLRINPGNIGGEAHVRELAAAAKAHHIPIRIGVNTGSIEKDSGEVRAAVRRGAGGKRAESRADAGEGRLRGHCAVHEGVGCAPDDCRL